MSVPETTVDLDDCAPAGEDQVWLSCERTNVEPKTETLPVQAPAHYKLRLCVLAANPGHHATARGGVDNVTRQGRASVVIVPEQG
jgi:hypothetical protein